MDRKGIHILFCDQDPESASETLSLLEKCSYKVTAVKSGRKVIETLESGSSGVDIILFDFELPGEKGFKMLKHVTRTEEFNHIAVVVMSERDEMAVVAKCLQLGAVDYLVKPLRLNEVMNLWTHMWRRRRMLGLPEKHVVLNIINTSSLNLLKDAESPSYSKNNAPIKDPKDSLNIQMPAKLELSLKVSNTSDVGKADGDPKPRCSIPRQTEGHRSAFSAYLKKPSNPHPSEHSANMCSSSSPSQRSPGKLSENPEKGLKRSTHEVCSTIDTFFGSAKDSCMVGENRAEDTESLNCFVQSPCIQNKVTSKITFGADQVPSSQSPGSQQYNGFAVCPSRDMRQGSSNVPETAEMTCSSQVSIQQASSFYNQDSNMALPESTSSVFSYYPMGQIVLPQYMGFSSWPAAAHVVGNKTQQAERREAALQKFRLKRKGRCFEKKIRYVSRKKLAEQRPRVRGQFVKRTAVVDSLDAVPNPIVESGYHDEEGEADDERGYSEMDANSSPECNEGRDQVS